MTTAVASFTTAVMLPTVPKPTTELRKLLETKFLYQPSVLAGRTKVFSLGPDADTSRPNAICYEAFEGVPFSLFIASDTEPTKALRDSAFAHVKQSETIGTVGFYAHDSGTLSAFRRRFRDNEFEAVQEIEYYYPTNLPLNERQTKSGPSREERGLVPTTTLLPITNKLENIFFEIHSVMRDIDGLHADAALEELCKLLYLKSYIEEQGEQLKFPGMRAWAFGTVDEFAACLRALYRQGIEYDLRVFRLKIPEYERSRGVFDQPIYLSNAALVKAFKQLEAYSLLRTDADIKGRAFQKVLTKAIRSGMGQYFTPVQVCQLMVDVLNPTSSDLILDPFCGSGHFLTASLSHVKHITGDSSKEYHEFAYGKLHGIEKSDRMTRIAMTDMRLHGDGHSNIRCTDALLDFRNYPDIHPESFDIVLTNPPFGSLLGSEAFSGLGHFELLAGRRRVPLEVLGLERAIRFLRPGGRIGIVLPESVFSGESCKHVREWLLRHLAIRVIVDLPNETFAPFGANVRSGILFGRKLEPGEQQSKKTKVCMIRLDNLGYDASGRPTEGSELRQVVLTATEFIGKEGW